MADVKRYTPRDYSKVRGLNGISDKQIEEHLKLYEGYVKRTNALTEKLSGHLRTTARRPAPIRCSPS